jgi:ketosteroid isomerase-like protein
VAFTGSSEAMQSIRELHETYSDAVVRQDLEAYLACWTEDGRRTRAGGDWVFSQRQYRVMMTP